MSRIDLMDPAQPLAQQLTTALRYPFRETALPALIGYSLAHYLALLPAIGWALESVIWAATYLYALECLRQTADGFAMPPEFAEPGHGGWALVAILLWATLLTLLMKLNFGGGWLVSVLMAISLPAIAMSLALDGGVLNALNPITWLRVMSRFGAPYLLLIGVQLLVALVVGVAQQGFDQLLPQLLALPLFYFVATYAIVFNFHLMGALIHQRHDHFGLQPKAHALAAKTHQDDDQRLLEDVASLAPEQPQAALELLVPRLRDKLAPDALHQAYRQILKQLVLKDAMLVHGQIWMAALLARGDARRALGVLQECIGLDPAFIPDDPRTCGELADLAARLGIQRIALALCRGYLTHWPRDPKAVHYGLLASRLLAGEPERLGEALTLLDRLLAAWPAHPQHAELAAQRQRLASLA